MDFLVTLWAPILLSAAAVWILSAIAWMALPHHRKDYIKLPSEQPFLDFLKTQNVPQGNYSFPHFACHSDSQKEEAKKKWMEGPTGFITILPKQMGMAKNMIVTFLVFLVATCVIAYLASLLIPVGTGFIPVFRVVGTMGVLAYCFAFIPHAVWFGQYTRAIVACIFDGVLYGLATGAIFAWLWPSLPTT